MRYFKWRFHWPWNRGTLTALYKSTFQASELGWKSPKTISFLLLGILLLLLFAFWQTIHPYPLLSPSIWKNTNFTLCIVSVGLGYMAFITNSFWIMLYMQDVQSILPLNIAVRLMPQVFAGILWSYLAQYLVSRWSGKVIIGIGGIAYVVGAILVNFIREDTSYWTFLFPALCITVVGADFQFVVANLYISQEMPTQSSLGAGFLQTSMRLSISVGLSITSAAYGSVASTLAGKENRTLPYERAYLCSIIFAVLGLSAVPFMKIGRQGTKAQPLRYDGMIGIPKNMSRLSKLSNDSLENSDSDVRSSLRYKPTNANRASVSTIMSMVSVGSADTWNPRWSFEAEEARSTQNDQSFLYEVCTKCMEERRRIMHTNENGLNFFGGLWEGVFGYENKPDAVWKGHHRHTWSGNRGFIALDKPLAVWDEKGARSVERTSGRVQAHEGGWM